MNESSRKSMRFFASLILWGVMTIIWSYVWYDSYAEIIQLPFFRRGNWVVVGIYAFLLFIITQFYGGYRIGFYRRGDIIFSCLMSMFVTNIVTYLQVSLIGRMFMDPWPIVWMSVAHFVIIWIWATAADRLYLKLHPPRQLLCVYGGSQMARSMITKIAERDDKYIINEAVNIEDKNVDILEKLGKHRAVLICDVKGSDRNRLLKYCYERDIRVYMVPKISDIIIRSAGINHLFDSPLLLNRNNGLSFEQILFKRAFDIIGSILALVVFSPFMLIVAAAIKLHDGGPVFYVQERLTINGRLFKLYKFRSMVENAEDKNGVQLANQNDDRITTVGRVIRKIRFDEMPQLINILKGDMSFVGPRPERPEIEAEYKKSMPEFDFRLKVKAGLTGYAQVLGKYNTTPYDKLKLDLMYITSYSFLIDIKLILMTIKILFMSYSTEGIDDGAVTAESIQKD